MSERHARAIQKYSAIEEDDVRHVLEVIALDIGRDDSPAHTSLRKIAKRVRRSVNKVRDLIELAIESGELIRHKEGKYHIYSLNPDRIPYGRTSKRVNNGKFGPEMKPATLADLQRLEEQLSEQQQRLYQKLYHDIVYIVSRSVEGRDTKDIEKECSKGDDPVSTNKRLITHFEQETGIMADSRNFESDWLPVIEEWREAYGEEKAKLRISNAVRFARGENPRGKTYVITSPRSLVTIDANMPSNGQVGTIKVGSR